MPALSEKTRARTRNHVPSRPKQAADASAGRPSMMTLYILRRPSSPPTVNMVPLHTSTGERERKSSRSSKLSAASASVEKGSLRTCTSRNAALSWARASRASSGERCRLTVHPPGRRMRKLFLLSAAQNGFSPAQAGKAGRRKSSRTARAVRFRFMVFSFLFFCGAV